MSASFLDIGKKHVWGGDRPVGLSLEDRARHLYCLGQSGTGKSTILRHLFAQDIAAGRGTALVDPHGDLASEIFDLVPSCRIDDVVIFDPTDISHPVGFNPFYRVPRDERPLVASNMISTFKHVWADSWGPRLEYILYNTVAAILDAPDHLRPTFLSIPRVLVERPYRTELLRHLQDPRVRSFFEDEFNNWNDRQVAEALSSVQNKIGQVVSNPFVRNIIGQWHPSIQLDQIIRERKVLILRLPKGQLGETQTNLLGSFVVSGLMQAAMRQAETRTDFNLTIDEFQNFTTDSFASILSESRKFRLSLTIAHQFTSQVSDTIRDAVFGNAGNIISFRVGADDADRLAHEFGGLPASVFRDLKRGEIAARLTENGEVREAFVGRTEPNTQSHGHAAKVIAKSRRTYAKPRTEVERRIGRWIAS